MEFPGKSRLYETISKRLKRLKIFVNIFIIPAIGRSQLAYGNLPLFNYISRDIVELRDDDIVQLK